MAPIIFYVYYNGEMTYSDEAFSTKGKNQDADIGRRGFGSGIRQNRCPSVENKFTDNPSVNRLLIGSGGWVD